MKKILITILTAIFVVVISVATIRATMIVGVYRTSEGLYTSTKDDENYILYVGNDNKMTLYHYAENGNGENAYYYGAGTHYEVSGITYNRLLFSIHYLPLDSVWIWNRFALYDEAKEQRSRITMSVSSNELLNMNKNYQPITRTFRNDLVITEDSITIGDMTFMKVTQQKDIDSLMVIIDYFTMNAKKV